MKYREFKDAVHNNDQVTFVKEAIQVAAVAIQAVASVFSAGPAWCEGRGKSK
jgi:hypothetical protein